jgi:hypothetical protein
MTAIYAALCSNRVVPDSFLKSARNFDVQLDKAVGASLRT